MKKKTYDISYSILLFCFTLWLFGCGSDGNHALNNNSEGVICAVLAHPDDETIISGTLSMLTGKGFDITVVYVTSGDDGPDETGKGLYGNALGAVRENEALRALRAIGIKNPPVFLRYPDGHVQEYADSVQHTLNDLFEKISPQVVISFGPDGITGSRDHKFTGYTTDLSFDLSDSGRLLLHMAITKPLPPFFARGVAVPKNTVDVCVNVSKYAKQRTRVVEAHHTQFNSRTRSSYKILVHTMRTEKFIIAGNRSAGEWLERCF
jgi:LmbE family N-acetylglucosaminyl deacetylase